MTITVKAGNIKGAIVRVLDFGLLFSAGALLDPGVHAFLGTHQGVATGVALVILALRAAEKALGGKTEPSFHPAVPDPNHGLPAGGTNA